MTPSTLTLVLAYRPTPADQLLTVPFLHTRPPAPWTQQDQRLSVEIQPIHAARITTDSNRPLSVAPNVLARQFAVVAPDRAWVTDIRYLWTQDLR